MILTNKGRNLQAKAQTGIQLNFTRIGIGDGYLGTSSIVDLNALKHEIKSLDITKIKTLSDGKALLGTILSNQDIIEGFYFREIGVFAQDPDLGEILYCYGNSGDNAEYIPAGGGPDVVEKSIDIITIVGNAPNVTAKIDESLIFITPEEAQEMADQAESRAKEYADQQLASFEVPVKSVNNKTGDVILSAADVGAETPTGAQQKAEAAAGAALAAAKQYTDQEVAEISQALDAHKAAAAPHSGHETPAGAQAKANTAEANAKAYTDAHEQKAAPHSGHETPAGAQAKADAALNSAKQYTDQEVGEVAQALTTHLADDNPHGLVLPANSKNNNAAVADFPNGISHMYANQAGLGFPVQYAHIITFRNGNTGYQLACSTTASSEIYMRSSSGGVFGTWKQIPSYDDPRFSDSRKCNNTFDDAATARNNLGGRKITSGTAAPSGGSNGDIYFQR
ncbi:MAG: hypothetical protein GXW85_04980 [Clostridia bacterium]|nr:hypothetical protein [Clostridia bacterium]